MEFALQSPARFGFVALDEGLDDETPPAILLERCAYIVDLGALGARDIEPCDRAVDFEAARARLPRVAADPIGRRGVGVRRRPAGGPIAARASLCASRGAGDLRARRPHAYRG